jgi:hypothetical protein
MLADVGNGSAKTGRKLTFLNAMVRQECVAISIKIGGSQSYCWWFCDPGHRCGIFFTARAAAVEARWTLSYRWILTATQIIYYQVAGLAIT